MKRPDEDMNEGPVTEALPVRVPGDGESAIHTVIDNGYALVAGCGEPFGGEVSVLLNGDPATLVRSVVLGWSRPVGGAAFVALIPLAKFRRGRLQSVLFRNASRPARYTLGGPPVEPARFLTVLSEDAGDAFPALVDGLIGALASGEPSAQRLAAVEMLVRSSARADGFAEMVGRFEDGGLFVQGWSHELAPGKNRVVVVADSVDIATMWCGVYKREDLGEKARGYAGIVEGANLSDPVRLKRLYFRGRERWHQIEAYQHRTIVDGVNVPGQVRSVLPRLATGSEALKKLQWAATRFDGRDTVSDNPLPVRVGIDLALQVEAGGLLMTGWVLDPERHIDRVVVHSVGQAERLDGIWSRQARPDVSRAYEGNPLFSALQAGRHQHGFIVFARQFSVSPGGRPHIELVLKTGASVYFPLNVTRSSLQGALGRLFGMFDPGSATVTSALRKHCLPILQNVEAEPPRIAATTDHGDMPEKSARALVVGCDDSVGDMAALLPLLALDPATRVLPIVIAGPEDAINEQAGNLMRLANFYRLTLRLVAAEGVQDSCDALETGVEAAPGEAVICLSANVMPQTEDWLPTLERAFTARQGQCVVSPSIVFEDDSIRWAGTWLEGEGATRTLSNHYVGYPRAALTGAEPCEVVAPTLDCCLVTKTAFQAAGGFTRGYAGPGGKAHDFALKLRMAGTRTIWVPQVHMVATEPDSGYGAPWKRLVRDLDRASFDARWSLAISNLNR